MSTPLIHGMALVDPRPLLFETWRAAMTAAEEEPMFAVVGRVKIKPGQEDLTRQMISDQGVGMVRAMSGSKQAYWSRAVDGAELVQHSFWLFDTEENARAAQATFNLLRDMADAPAEWIGCDVCEVIGTA